MKSVITKTNLKISLKYQPTQQDNWILWEMDVEAFICRTVSRDRSRGQYPNHTRWTSIGYYQPSGGTMTPAPPPSWQSGPNKRVVVTNHPTGKNVHLCFWSGEPFSKPVLSIRTWKFSVTPNVAAISYNWVLSTWNVASMTWETKYLTCI